VRAGPGRARLAGLPVQALASSTPATAEVLIYLETEKRYY
jgi:hypothetical protein